MSSRPPGAARSGVSPVPATGCAASDTPLPVDGSRGSGGTPRLGTRGSGHCPSPRKDKPPGFAAEPTQTPSAKGSGGAGQSLRVTFWARFPASMPEKIRSARLRGPRAGKCRQMARRANQPSPRTSIRRAPASPPRCRARGRDPHPHPPGRAPALRVRSGSAPEN